LLARLEKPVVLSRDGTRAEKELAEFQVKAYSWDPRGGPPPEGAFDGVDTVIHLAGEPVAEGRWTAAKKERLRESRVAGTRNLVQGMVKLAVKPKVLISASAVGYYGSQGDSILTEEAKPQADFLAEICAAWERESHAAREIGIRVINPRIGIVLGENGGALAKMLPPFYFGIGSPLGSGKQYMPWVHIDDLVGMILFAAQSEKLAGAMNATAPTPVTNREFTNTLGRVLGRPTFMPAVPPFALKLVLGEFAEVLLMSQRAVPQAALTAGYQFKFRELEPALRDVLKK
jgi:uncharacterized protein (TIGR01777 family)